jgi:hypothetical protein
MLSGFSKMESAHSSQKLSLSASSEKLSFERVSLRVLALVKERSYEVPGAHERLGVMLAKNPLTYFKQLSCENLSLIVLALAQERTD